MDYIYEARADFEENGEYVARTYTIRNNTLFTPHYHNSIELLSVNEGHGTATVNSKTFDVKAGDIIAVNSKQVHYLCTNTNLTYGCIIIKPTFLKKHDFLYKENYLKNLIRDNELSEYFLKVCSANPSGGKWKAKMTASLVLIIAIKLFTEYTENEKSSLGSEYFKKNNLVIDIMDYIGSNCTEKISVNDIADKLCYSKFYLCRTFKEITNQTIIEYTTRLKCAKAMNDLKSGQYTVHEVANKYGFFNFSYFSKVFKKYTGHSPSCFKSARMSE